MSTEVILLGATPIGHAVCIQLVVSRFCSRSYLCTVLRVWERDYWLAFCTRLPDDRVSSQMPEREWKRVTLLAGLSLQANYCSVSHPLQQQTKLSLIHKWTMYEHNG